MRTHSRLASFTARLRSRRRRGLTLFGSLLAVAVMALLALGASQWAEQRWLEARDERAAEQMAILAHAARAFVVDNYADLLAGPMTREVTLAELRTAELLSDFFPDRDTMKRGYRVLLRRDTGGRGVIDLLVTQTLADGDVRWPYKAAASRQITEARLGTVWPDDPDLLRGPGISVDVSDFQGDFSGVPEARAMAAWARLDRQSIFGSQLYRVAVPGFEELNQMVTAIDMNGNAITQAGRIEAREIEVEDTVEIGGALTVTGTLTAQSAAFTGALATDGEVTAGSAAFDEAIESASLEADGAITAASLTAAGEVQAARIGASGDMTIAGAATVGPLTAAMINAPEVSTRVATVTEVRSDNLSARNDIRVDDGFFSTITTGRCTGC